MSRTVAPSGTVTTKGWISNANIADVVVYYAHTDRGARGKGLSAFVLAFGVPAHAYGLNSVGLTRAGVSPVHRTMLKRAFMLLYRSRLGVSTALGRMDAELGSDPYVREMIEFIRGSQERGIIRWTKERDEE